MDTGEAPRVGGMPLSLTPGNIYYKGHCLVHRQHHSNNNLHYLCVCVCVHVGPHWLIYLTHTHTHTLSRAVNHSLLHKVMRLTCYMYVHIGSYTQHTLTLSCNESLPYKVMRLNMLHLGPHWLIYLINTHTHTLMQ